jgi:hypothetical protein
VIPSIHQKSPALGNLVAHMANLRANILQRLILQAGGKQNGIADLPQATVKKITAAFGQSLEQITVGLYH